MGNFIMEALKTVNSNMDDKARDKTQGNEVTPEYKEKGLERIKELMSKISQNTISDNELLSELKWILINLNEQDRTSVSEIIEKIKRIGLLESHRQALLCILGKKLTKEFKELSK